MLHHEFNQSVTAPADAHLEEDNQLRIGRARPPAPSSSAPESGVTSS